MSKESDETAPETWKISLISPVGFVSALEEFFYGQPFDSYPSVTAFEIKGDPENWLIEVYVNEQPAQDELEQGLIKLGDIFGQSPPALTIEPLGDIDWVSQSQKILKPINAGKFYLFGNHDAATVPDNKIPILMDAGQAFGTGSHETTKGCLLAIDELRDRLTPTNALDLGCGSGILAIALAKQWDLSVTASDIDPIATETAAENMRLNHLDGIKFITCNGFEDAALSSSGPFDLIIANILAEPLKLLAGDIADNLCPDGTLILSGLLREQQQDIIEIYRENAVILEKSFPINEWQTLLLKKK